MARPKREESEKLYSVNMMINKEIHEAAASIAHQNDMSFSQYMRSVLRDAIKKHRGGLGRG